MAVPHGSLRFGPGDGTLFIRTRRTGFASKVGHDLTLELTGWSAQVEVPDPAGPFGGRVAATIDLSTMTVREGSGGAVPLTDRDRREIEGNARRMLEVDRYPTATFAADRIIGTSTEATVIGMLSIHGSQGQVQLHVRQVPPDGLVAEATVAQTAFGIKPYSAFLGALKLRDEVAIECRVDFTHAATPDQVSS
ncbi:MAG TPA: YceI family protein [Jiangellaceae bacterium]